ncbi:hypothetical protein Tco_0138351 [Tanacetum coccineum]
MADVHRLSAHVIKLRDMPEGVLVLSGLIMGIHDFLCLPEWTGAEVQEEPYLDVRPTLQRLSFFTTLLLLRPMYNYHEKYLWKPVLSWRTVECKFNVTLVEEQMSPWKGCYTPSSKIVSKAEASQKRKASTSGATSSHVAKRTRSPWQINRCSRALVGCGRQRITLAEYMILSGADNRPPMLEKDSKELKSYSLGSKPAMISIHFNHHRVAKDLWERVQLLMQGFAVPVFSPGDDPIACLNKAMAFLTAVASSSSLYQ